MLVAIIFTGNGGGVGVGATYGVLESRIGVARVGKATKVVTGTGVTDGTGSAVFAEVGVGLGMAEVPGMDDVDDAVAVHAARNTNPHVAPNRLGELSLGDDIVLPPGF